MTVLICPTTTVEVYRTTVNSRLAADVLLQQLHWFFPGWCISFDLEDCDRVLRVETTGDPIPDDFITGLLARSGYQCAPLPD